MQLTLSRVTGGASSQARPFDRLRVRAWGARFENLILSLSKDEVFMLCWQGFAPKVALRVKSA
ncbi:hypothetical protein SGCZBJ_21875 [Caulobacter zeae]|uniref:Uncharacterized protein n=1 Tax=Caulobacter zeae TaxID=2055137 RepID=A0A2N5D226_9CAUL|nr:hypothetical protein SGCZBJ_21875 [Caulobacter zeae]